MRRDGVMKKRAVSIAVSSKPIEAVHQRSGRAVGMVQ
jgi:hypothetical protein